MMLSATQAKVWLDRWDRQQETYIADREERFDVIADLVALNVDDAARIVDLGCGPGSLSVRLSERFPQASILGVDADPLLLGLAGAAYADRRAVRFVRTDLRTPDWTDALGMDRQADAVVSTTALHWLRMDELAAVYRGAASMLRVGGLFVNGDHFRTNSASVDRLAAAVRDGRSARVGHQGEDWEAWWTAVGEAPDLAGLVGERGAQPLSHQVDEPPTLEDHTRLLWAAGFSDVAVVWQHGDDRVLTATRDGGSSAPIQGS